MCDYKPRERDASRKGDEHHQILLKGQVLRRIHWSWQSGSGEVFGDFSKSCLSVW